MRDTVERSPVFACKNYPPDGVGGIAMNVAVSPITLTATRSFGEISTVFCSRFFNTKEEAGMWMQTSDGPIDFRAMTRNMPYKPAPFETIGRKEGTVVGVVLVTSSEEIDRMWLETVADFVNYLNTNAKLFVQIPHAVFHVCSTSTELANKWAMEFCADSVYELRTQIHPVTEWAPRKNK